MNISKLIVRFTVSLLLLYTLEACTAAPPTVGQPTPFEAVCTPSNDGQRVAVDGYLYFPDTFRESQSVIMRLHQSDTFDGTPVGVQMSFGKLANQVEAVPAQFRDEDLQVHLADGTVAGFRTRVSVSGTVYFPLAKQPFACALENPLIALAD